jgi:hypothetical protein
MNMDSMMGTQFEQGLQDMKKIVESKPQTEQEPAPADSSATAQQNK